MSNSSIAGDKYGVEVTPDTINASVSSEPAIKSWHIEILVVVVGLLALIFFIAMGGVFSMLGPWVIYMCVVSNRKHSGSGGQILRIIAGAGLVCLSAAALLLAKQIEPWCILGGVMGLLSGLVYVATTLLGIH